MAHVVVCYCRRSPLWLGRERIALKERAMSVPKAGASPVRLGLTAAAALLIGSLGATAANAAFNDVPPENQNSEHIANVQDAGIATGFADGSFRPRDALTRQ